MPSGVSFYFVNEGIETSKIVIMIFFFIKAHSVIWADGVSPAFPSPPLSQKVRCVIPIIFLDDLLAFLTSCSQWHLVTPFTSCSPPLFLQVKNFQISCVLWQELLFPLEHHVVHL